MKLLEIVEILLIGLTTAVVSNLEPGKEQEDFIKQLNAARKSFADEHKISEMVDLVWSSELQTVADKVDYHKLPLPEERKWRLTLVRDYATGVKGLQTDQSFYFPVKNVPVTNMSLFDDYSRGLEHINPLQKTIACAKQSEVSLERGFTVICLLGPESRIIELFKFCEQKADDKVVKTKRLCWRLDNLKYDQLYFIGELNKARQGNAKTKNVNNMHELTWNKEMHNKALSLTTQSKQVLPQNRNFRFTWIDTYQNGPEELKNSNRYTIFTELDKSEVKFYQNKEYLHPLQTDIACVPVKDSFICLLGPEAESIEDIKSPPQQCKEEFEKVREGDLCSRKPKEIYIPPADPVSTKTPESAIQTPGTAESEPESTGTCAIPTTTPVPRVSFTRFTTEKVTPEPAPRLPKELEDYEELDGDEYDEDFPTGEPPRYKRNSSFVPSCFFSILLVFVSCF